MPSPSAPTHGGLSAEMSSEQVAILLSTYNGATYLPEQLDSLVAQTHTAWTVYASDDGSSDQTLDVLRQFQERLGPERLVILKGPQRGFAANFLSLLARAEVQARYFAFCDQDDLWMPDRLERGLRWMRQHPQDKPALFCSRTQLVDAHGHPLGMSPEFRRLPCFENALVQSIAGGNTMLINAHARDLLRQTRLSDHIVSHDWWAYIVVSGCGGSVGYDPVPTIGYRQHGNNIIGSNNSFRDRLVRLRKLLHGTFRSWTDYNLQALSPFRARLTSENRSRLELFEQGRRAPLWKRLKLIHDSGVHRQTLLGNLGLTAAAILQRI